VTVSLGDFLTARLDEEQRVAEAASSGPWTYQDVESVGGGRICDPTVEIANMSYDPPGELIDPRIRRTRSWEEADRTASHIVLWDPVRVLAEVAGKRKRITYLAELASMCPEDDWPSTGGMELAPMADLARWLLKVEGQPYAGHPEFRPEWAMETAARTA
jgi:hypothetical protein